jgi:bla regulator protein blaR1
MVRKTFALFIFLTLPLLTAFAQSSFEVASIKPSDPDSRGVSFRVGPGGLNMNGITVKTLIQEAYDVRESQISGGPGWISSARYDIIAKIDRGADAAEPQNPDAEQKAREQQRERLRALLADRFQLKIKIEKKELPTYALTVAKGGPKMKETKPEEPVPAPKSENSQERPRGNLMRVGRGQIIGQSITMDLLAKMLSQQLGRNVVDKTGLRGTYDYTLEWTPDPAQGLGPGFSGPGEPPRPDNPAPAESNGVSVFVAIQEQLGLKLEPQKELVDIIVIESVERPSEN